MIGLVVVLMGCQYGTPASPEIGQWTSPDEGQAVSVNSAIGPAPLRVEYRLLTPSGIPSAGEPVSVTVNGVPVNSEVDAGGYGEIELTEVGEYTLVVGDQHVQAWVTDALWREPALPPTFPSVADSVSWVEPMEKGLLVGGPTGLWWLGESSAYSVFDPQGWLIRGVRVGHLDEDGVLDALVWTDNRLVLLRGRLAGGVSLGAVLADEDYSVASAHMGDVSEDGQSDVVVAWRGQEEHWLTVYEGDGIWDYRQAAARYLSAAPTGLGVGSNTARGRLEITVSNEAGLWERFTHFGDRTYLPVGPKVDVVAPTQSWVESGYDLNGDGADEVLLIGSSPEHDVRDVVILNFLAENPEYLTLNLPTVHVAFGDVTGDGLTDLLQMFDTGNVQAFHAGEGGYGQQNVVTFPKPAAFAMSDQNVDGGLDLLVAGDRTWSWHWGASSETGQWEVLETPIQSLGVNQYDGFLGIEAGDKTSFARVYGGANMTVFTQYTLDKDGDGVPAESGWTVLTYEALDVLDGAVCDQIAWVLLDGVLARVNVQGPTPVVTGTLATSGTRVTCGVGPSNTKAALVVDGEVALLNNALMIEGTESAAGAVDVAFGRQDGVPVVGTCADIGCSIEGWFIDGPTQDSVWAIGGETLHITDGDAVDIRHALSVDVRIGDVSGDGGETVLLVGADGIVGVLRSPMAPVELWTAPEWLSDVVWAADADGDTQPELWVVDQVGDIGWLAGRD